jgi:hypothetical protein
MSHLGPRRRQSPTLPAGNLAAKDLSRHKMTGLAAAAENEDAVQWCPDSPWTLMAGNMLPIWDCSVGQIGDLSRRRTQYTRNGGVWSNSLPSVCSLDIAGTIPSYIFIHGSLAKLSGSLQVRGSQRGTPLTTPHHPSPPHSPVGG